MRIHIEMEKKFLQGTLFLLDPSPIIALSPLATIEGKGSRIAVTTFDLCYIRFIGAANFCPNKGFCVSENAQQQCLWAHTSFALKRRSTTFVLFFFGGGQMSFLATKNTLHLWTFVSSKHLILRSVVPLPIQNLAWFCPPTVNHVSVNAPIRLLICHKCHSLIFSWTGHHLQCLEV